MNLENEIKDAIIAITDAFENEKHEKYGDIIAQLLNSETAGYWWETAEKFNIGFVFPARQALETAIEQKYPNVDIKHRRMITVIYAHYNVLKHHIENIIEPFEGFSCLADKSRRLLKEYLEILVNNNETADDWTVRHKWSDKQDPETLKWDCGKRKWNCPVAGRHTCAMV